MSKSLNSPTSRLLQSSRLFSLPRPLPQPSLDLATSANVYRGSETATLPYPTHQSIATPSSSHFRGDWGLKRPLPTKATKRSSTPHIKVRQQDNTAHITDFGSAADHTQTEAKWRQMGIPMVVKEQRTMYSDTSNYRVKQSVYDDNLDNTDPDFSLPQAANDASPAALPYGGSRNNRFTGLRQTKEMKRWKYAGPWITGMQEGEFELYITSKIAKRKDEFRRFMVERLLNKRINDEQRLLREQGQDAILSDARKVELREEILGNYELEEKRLRDDHAVQLLTSELTAAICDFLDLPGIRSTEREAVSVQTQRLKDSVSNFLGTPEANAPPSTHPGAGLSHIRTNAYMENHPLWGPQAYRSPVLARVLRPRNTAQGTEYQAKIGVGGVVTHDPHGGTGYMRPRNSNKPPATGRDVYKDYDEMANAIDPDLENGNKFWVQPDTASIDEKGLIRLEVNRGDKEAIAVAEKDIQPILDARNAANSYPSATSYRFAAMPPPGTAGNANYGSGLPDKRYHSVSKGPRSDVTGFDAELGRQPQQGQMPDTAAAERVRQLLHRGRT